MELDIEFTMAAYDAAATRVGDAVLKLNHNGQDVSKDAIVGYLAEQRGYADNDKEKMVLDLALRLFKGMPQEVGGIMVD
ncbi:hypothetical protein FJU30_10055 [Affinibrenneria salicis]|uniref:Uncharacterized protein n=1 Tax=Affinibrenneria salicis TaxID=2590031 RepID=A0A5J5G1M6_9GAMM|nr:hypothetical protein [Affinibrenneria salicis]KAA9000561.1 hypothetical protein FJU30_10055 [Affinibrenneria salicis]